jgi:hypothetical protein
MIIYKYKLGIVEHQVIELPVNFKPLKVEFQGKQLCMWAMVDLLNSKNHFDFYIIGTGQEWFDSTPLEYISTVFQGAFVWHIFYRKIS